jgi:hypothetical protein
MEVIPRAPWPKGFPAVVIHTDLRTRNGHPGYPGGKSGDPFDADAIAQDLIAPEAVEELSHVMHGRKPVLLPVVADEVAGFNAIPDAMAHALSNWFGFPVATGEIVQRIKVGHTKANGWHRLVTPAEFMGDVRPGADYLLIDDHVGFGGTLANLRGFFENGGGRVVGMTTLTETRGARQIAVRKSTLAELYGRHGTSLEHLWQRLFGYGLDCLTEVEAGYLGRVESVAAIQDRMAQAAKLARGRGLSAVGSGTGA